MSYRLEVAAKLGLTPIAQIAKQTGLSCRAIYRIESDPVAAETALKI